MIRKTCLLLMILILGGGMISAQSLGDFKKKRASDLQAYKEKQQGELEAYKRKVNEEFAAFLRKPWERKTPEKPLPEKSSVPEVAPVVMLDEDIEVPEDNALDVEVNFPPIEEKPLPVAPIPYKRKPEEKTISFTFYGTVGYVRFDSEKTVRLAGPDEERIARFWMELSQDVYDNLVSDCQRIKDERGLCDWAYFKMTEKVAGTLYQGNEQAVFHAWLLTQSGFRVRLGRENQHVHLLVNCTAPLFDLPYFRCQSGDYFLVDGTPVQSMYMFGKDFPHTVPLRMSIASKNAFEVTESASRLTRSQRFPEVEASVRCSENLLAFLRDVPPCAINGTKTTDFARYASLPLSLSVRKRLYPVLKSRIDGKSEEEAANVLLNYVQTAFEYKTDNEVWGRERTFFPEETFYYPYCDCEDRAILFCRLVKDLLGLDTAFVSYPGHLAAAVHFNSAIPGDHFLIDGKRYLICDPTYINAPIGWTMPGMDNSTAQVVMF